MYCNLKFKFFIFVVDRNLEILKSIIDSKLSTLIKINSFRTLTKKQEQFYIKARQDSIYKIKKKKLHYTLET